MDRAGANNDQQSLIFTIQYFLNSAAGVGDMGGDARRYGIP
ncbi:hypothetical protein EC178200_1663 [Escherichia coli 178200]|nr:hypothetical protein EC178200_1663 [Escherichia coli 178200]